MPSPELATVAPASTRLLEAVEITKRHWDDFLALDTVSLSVSAGEIYCLLGAAGAGKTLLLHIFLGFVAPTAGRALVCGTDVASDPTATRDHLTYVAQGTSMYGSLTARQNVEFFTKVDGNPVALDRGGYYNAMRRVGIPERYFERRARDLEPAVLALLWLAIGLLKNTPVLLFDEPTVGLDLYASAGMQETLMQFREHGKALLVATSDVLLAGGIADRVGILKEGRKRIELPRSELVGRSLPELYLEFMGRPLTVGNRGLPT
jgi:ABC-2 type transport system ATP-binding protein